MRLSTLLFVAGSTFLLPLTSVAHAWVTFTANNTNATFPTWDPLMIAVNPYVTTGTVVIGSFQPNVTCQFAYPNATIAKLMADPRTNNDTKIVLGVTETAIKIATCSSVARVSTAKPYSTIGASAKMSMC